MPQGVSKKRKRRKYSPYKYIYIYIYTHTHTHTHTELEGLRGLHLILYLLILFNSHLLSKPWFNILEMLNLANSLYAFY